MAVPYTGSTISGAHNQTSIETLRINRVANGWSVMTRPPSENAGYCIDPKSIYVFTTLSEMTRWMLENL